MGNWCSTAGNILHLLTSLIVHHFEDYCLPYSEVTGFPIHCFITSQQLKQLNPVHKQISGGFGYFYGWGMESGYDLNPNLQHKQGLFLRSLNCKTEVEFLILAFVVRHICFYLGQNAKHHYLWDELSFYKCSLALLSASTAGSWMVVSCVYQAKHVGHRQVNILRLHTSPNR